MRRSSCFAAATAGALLMAAAAPAEAQTAQTADKPRQTAPIVTASLSLVCPFVPGLMAIMMTEAKLQENWSGMRAALYIGGGLGFAFAGTSFALEATTAGACGSGCKTSYGIAIGGTVLSALAMAGAIGMTVTSPRKKRRAMVFPLVLPAEKGTALGVGVGGWTF